MNKQDKEKRAKILHLLLKGNSLRGTAELEDVSPNTVQRLLILAGRAYKKFHDENVKDVRVRGWIEADELGASSIAKKRTCSGRLAHPTLQETLGRLQRWTRNPN